MPQDRIVIVALLANEDMRRNAKKYLATVTPASFPVILLVEGQELEARDRQRLDNAQHAALLAPAASITKGWLDELLVIAEQHPDSVVVPGSPNVNGPQRLILEEKQSVRYLKDQGPYAVNIRKHFANITQPIHYATDLVACSRGAWVCEALDTGGTSSREAFSALYRDRPLLLAQGAAVFSSEIKSQLIPGAPMASPLVSLCMIVKDEEEVIADALDSARGLADEVIVYDTGSTDDTVAIATRHGARVIQGQWRDDFAWARNQTLQYATGMWILWIDADERVRGDKEALRVRLEDPLAPFESYSIRIENVTGGGLTSFNHYANRVFRRKDCFWRGALHETIWYRDELRTCHAVPAPEMYLEHFGYLDNTMIDKKKADRNIRISEGNQSAASPEEAAMHEARSLMMANRLEEAIALVETQVIDGDSRAMRRLGVLALGSWYRTVGRYDDAEIAIERYEGEGYDPSFAHKERAQLAFEQKDYAKALAYADLVTETVVDYDGLTVSPDGLIGLKARCLVKLDRPDEASRLVIEGLARGVMDIHLNELIELMNQGQVPMSELADALPNDKEQLIIAQVLQIDPSIADDILVELHALRPDDRTLLAAASLVARHLNDERRHYWLGVLAECGLEGSLGSSNADDMSA
ncbi:glycosyltransferase [Ferrimicrobium acidiphilum]|uniref:SPBc2 prophage-derived glycosyltransferase SunS n=1 Tax=Ferrimicrobium acidiphilum DSM 19497 TaxID=1121877 RepID=A0A0D8FQT3_9ACTN|nr:glycosyltransferase [Ferrimicrobium acidiphilum]KJE75633.1 SPBc2 prophage-derived glycosyltransferase SunS [Ferrimicrobium acidiphilum DSM 19497]